MSGAAAFHLDNAGDEQPTGRWLLTTFQMEEAVELYMYASAPRPALHLLNHQLSDLLEPALDDRVAGEPDMLPALARLEVRACLRTHTSTP